MIILDCEQGSDEWLRARLGIPTASCFDKIITSTGTASQQANGYMNKLLAEWLTGEPLDSYKSDSMLMGNALEDDARRWYEFTQDVEVQQVGLVYRDERKLVAASPDGLTEPGGCEIKCPEPQTQIEYLLKNKVPTKYIPQVQGNIWMCERDQWDFLSYRTNMKPLLIRVNRDDAFITKLTERVDKFIDKMMERREQLRPHKEAM